MRTFRAILMTGLASLMFISSAFASESIFVDSLTLQPEHTYNQIDLAIENLNVAIESSSLIQLPDNYPLGSALKTFEGNVLPDNFIADSHKYNQVYSIESSDKVIIASNGDTEGGTVGTEDSDETKQSEGADNAARFNFHLMPS